MAESENCPNCHSEDPAVRGFPYVNFIAEPCRDIWHGQQPHTTDFDTTVIGQIKTFTGIYVTPLSMKPEMFRIEDIAHGLARICRYGGHCHGYLSVAEHCIAVSRMVPEEYALDALLHDRMEAYIGDIVRPIKRHPLMSFMRDIELEGERISADVFGVRHPIPQVVMDADRDRLHYEIENLRDDDGYGLLPSFVEQLFLDRYKELVNP